MPRYLVERTFPDGLILPPSAAGQKLLRSIVECNSDRNVTWIHSYISLDLAKMICVYDAPNPEAIRLTAKSNGLPVDRIIEVSVLDPYPFAYPDSPGRNR